MLPRLASLPHSASLPRLASLPLALGCLVLLTGCPEEAPPPDEAAVDGRGQVTAAEGPTDPTEEEFAAELNVDLDEMERRESGLYVQVLEEGEGPPAAPGDSMGVHYTVWFPDGTQLDSSQDREPPQPLPMVLGQTRLIEGWTEGVTGMREGERRRLVVPYDLAYGAEGRPPQVPPYSTLVFEVELAEHAPAER